VRRRDSIAVLGEVPANGVTGPPRDSQARKRRKGARRAPSESSEDRQYRKVKRRKLGKRKRARTTSSSGSEDESSSTEDGTGSEDSEQSSDSSESAKGSKTAKGKKKKASQGKWGMLNDIWPLETRPRKLQDREYVERQSWRTLNALQDRYEKEAERKGVGAAIFGKDRKLKKVSFKKKSDDGFARLHPARFLRLPLAAPEKYWRKVPKCHDQRFRHVQLSHYGAESQINEKVVLAMHDRQVRTLDNLGSCRYRVGGSG